MNIFNNEIEEAVNSFIEGWGYCRKTPSMEINTTGAIKKVNFRKKVYGRQFEFFHYYYSNMLAEELRTIYYPHWMTVFSNDEDVIQLMRDLGYKYQAKEYLMKYTAKDIMFKNRIYKVQEVKTREQAKLINNVLNFEKFNPDRIHDPHLRYYFIEINNRPVCTGIMSVKNNVSCLDRIYTDKDYRGLGLAGELCSFMLNISEENNAPTNILGSSEAGFHLYKKLGYKTVVPMYVFVNE